MRRQLEFDILPQPDDATCGPTCLHALYRYYEDPLTLASVIDQTQRLDEGGTLAVLLGCHALQRGYQARIITYNLLLFDPTWFTIVKPVRAASDEGALFADPDLIVDRLRRQAAIKPSVKSRVATNAYLDFLELGGELCMRDLDGALIRGYLEQESPVLTGLSSTYLYSGKREIAASSDPDDVAGAPCGHFVVLCGYDSARGKVSVADPYLPNPLGERHYYEVGLERLICAILLGVLTHDGNLLIIQPKAAS